MKKLCFVCFNVEDMGGITRVLSSLCNELCQNYSVNVVSICDTGKENHYFFDSEIKIYKINNNPDDRIRNIILKSFGKLKKYFSENNFDIIFMEGHYIPPIVLPLKLFVKSKFVFCDHGALNNQLSDKKATLFRKIAAKFSDKVIVLTQSTMDEYIKKFKIKSNKIDVIPNYIDSNVLKYKKEYNINSKLILSSGRFTPEKGFDMLVDVTSEVFKKHPDWKWHVYGNGPEFNTINDKIKENHLENNLYLMGLADNMYEKYSNYGIFVLTSYREGFALVLLEAKANALPLVSFDCVSGPSEIIRHGVDGYLIPCYNKKIMSKKICELIENSELRQSFSLNSESNLETFSKLSVTNKWTEIIKNL